MKLLRFSISAVLVVHCVSGAQKNWYSDYKYRAVIQVKNLSQQEFNEITVVLNCPVNLLIETGKIKSDASDMVLADESGSITEVKLCKKEKICNSILFDIKELPAQKRKIFYLYYGNPAQSNAIILDKEPVDLNPEKIVVSAGAEESKIKVEKKSPQNIKEWLEKYNPEKFDGRVWVRFRIDQPKDYRYNIVIDSEINPYTPARLATGTVSRYGLQPRMWQGINDWGKPIAWYPPVDESDWINAGEYSCWVELPVSKAAQWFTCFIVFPEKPSEKNKKPDIILHLEFATQPSEDFIFHVVDEKPDKAGINYSTGKYDVDGIVCVRMPTKTGLDGMKELGTFTEYTKNRLEKIKFFNLTDPPRLSKLIVGTWMQLIPYRFGIAGEASSERAETEFKILSDIGINCVTTSGMEEKELEKLFRKYHIIDTTITGWAGMWRYTSEAYSKKYDYLEGETSKQRWSRVFDDHYSKIAQRYSQTMPFILKTAKHFNTGDEIGPATDAREIRNTVQMLEEFRQYLKNQKLTLEMLGKNSWEQVYPETDREKLKENKIEYSRLFYYTKKFINDFSVMWYKSATDAIRKYFPDMKLIAPNFQAGPMQFAFIGNNNDMDTAALDIFELGRNRAFEGIMMEDWVYGWDAGIGRICLGADIMKAASRKWNLPMASYLVGGEAIKTKLFAYMISGIKENHLYLYGPIGNIGPAWADSEKALKETADITRKIKKFEDNIYSSKPRNAKIAQLIAFTSDLMQVKGLYFCQERQNVYALLKHCYHDVDIVSEQDITEENILKDYRVLIITDPNIKRDVQEKIVDWVFHGGKLISIAGAGNWDEFNQPCDILNKVFGIRQSKLIFQDDWLKWSAAFYSTAVSKFAYRQMGNIILQDETTKDETKIAVWGLKIDCLPVTCRILTRYEDGKPAIFYNKYGKGETVLIGALAGESYVREHWKQELKVEQQKLEEGEKERYLINKILDKLKIEKTMTLSTPGIYTKIMDFPEGILIFLNNASGKPVERLIVNVKCDEKIEKIDSLNSDSLDYLKNDNIISIEIPILEDVDIIRISTE